MDNKKPPSSAGSKRKKLVRANRQRNSQTEQNQSTPVRKLFKGSPQPDSEMSDNQPTNRNDSTIQQTPEIPEDALQNLISRFGPGIGDLLNNGPHRAKRLQKVQQLLSDIQAMGDETRQLQGVIELCDYFNMSMEELLGGFPVEQFVPSLVELLNYEHNPDMMLLATRALSYMIESIPKSTKIIVKYNAVPIFCNRLMFIQYIDVAEQTLQILGKLSKDHGKALLESGGLTAILTYLDFFGMSIQRSSVATAANLCKNVELQNFEFIVSVLPLLTNLLLNSDSKIVEYTILAFQRLTKSFSDAPGPIEAIAAEGLVANCIQLLSGAAPVGTIEAPGPLLNILQIVCKQKPEHIITLLEGGIAPILRNLLQSNEQNSTPTPNSSSYLLSLLGFVDEIYPPLPPNRSPIKVKREKYIIPQQLSDEAAGNTPTKHEQIFNENLPLFDNLSHCIYSPIKDTFSTNIDTSIRTSCLSTIMKIVFFIPEQLLDPLLKDLDTSTFVSTLLTSNRYPYVATALRLAAILLEKMPVIFTKYLTREGAVFAMDRLAAPSYLDGIDSLDEDTKKMKSWISTEAQQLKSKFFANPDTNEDEDGSAIFATEELKRLRDLLKRLKSETLEEQRNILEIIAEMLVTHGVSIFEFITAGAVDSLYEYLTEKSNELYDRWELFAEAMEAGKHARAPLQALISLLQNALTQSEKFVILLNDKKGRGSGIKYLAKPLKLRREKCEDENVLSDFSMNVVGIEPLASVSAVEKFLWEKIQPAEGTLEMEDELVIEDEDMDTNEFEEFSDNSEHVLEVEPPAALRASACLRNSRKSESNRRLQFYYNGVPLSPSDNIFRILQENFNEKLDIVRNDSLSSVTPAQRLWSVEHKLTYKRSTIASSSAPEPTIPEEPILLKTSTTNPMQHFLENNLNFDLPVPEELRNILLLLKFIHSFMEIYSPKSQNVQDIRRENSLAGELVANKITLKLSQQLQDTLILCCGELPPWCKFITHCCPFLLPFDVRRQYFTCTQLGIARALHCLQQIYPPEKGAQRFTVGRIQRQKVRVSRSHILQCAFRVMELYGRSKAVLEVEFFDEAGTGLGPTLEFFTLVSHQLQRADLGMWRYDNTYFIPIEDTQEISTPNNSTKSSEKQASQNPLQKQGPFEYVSNKGGLFPAPMREDAGNIAFVRKMFQLFGVVAGKALLDERMLDIHLSIPFFKWFIGKPLGMRDLAVIYPEIAKTMQEFLDLDAEYQAALVNAAGKSKEEIQKSILYRGCPIEDLCLNFVLPTQEHWELKENGKDIPVTLDNLREYVELVIDRLLISGVRIQMNAFRRGFQSVIPISSLDCFSVEEIEALICGWSPNVKEYWETPAILDAIVCDHQYTIQSLPVQYFAAALNLLDETEKRNFLFFLSGCPRLPIGGFKSLRPRLTVVRKDTEGSPDDYLPSVMTCVNYVKLPAYSSPEITILQLKKAISEGLASFHLS